MVVYPSSKNQGFSDSQCKNYEPYWGFHFSFKMLHQLTAALIKKCRQNVFPQTYTVNGQHCQLLGCRTAYRRSNQTLFENLDHKEPQQKLRWVSWHTTLYLSCKGMGLLNWIMTSFASCWGYKGCCSPATKEEQRIPLASESITGVCTASLSPFFCSENLSWGMQVKYTLALKSTRILSVTSIGLITSKSLKFSFSFPFYY